MLNIKNNHFNKNNKAFTLIELMVVIAIIGILTAIMTANFAAAKSRARDSKRISDLSQIQLALAGYFDRCNAYPTNINDLTTNCAGSVTPVNLGTFITKMPTPPTASEYYYYVTDITSGNYNAGDDYFLAATLENNGVASNNSLSATPAWWSASANTSSNNSIPSGNTIPTSGAAAVTCNTTGTAYCVGPK